MLRQLGAMRESTFLSLRCSNQRPRPKRAVEFSVCHRSRNRYSQAANEDRSKPKEDNRRLRWYWVAVREWLYHVVQSDVRSIAFTYHKSVRSGSSAIHLPYPPPPLLRQSAL